MLQQILETARRVLLDTDIHVMFANTRDNAVAGPVPDESRT
jgi:hypothetical protein